MSIRKYESLTPRGKRVRIAKDVLLQLKLKKIEVDTGMYYYKDNDKCTVCALGAVFVAKCNLVGDGFYLYEDQMRSELREVFSNEDMSILESFFEGWTSTDGSKLDPKYDTLVIKFRLNTPEDRLVALMNNIIRNRGMLVPQQLV